MAKRDAVRNVSVAPKEIVKPLVGAFEVSRLARDLLGLHLLRALRSAPAVYYCC
jgi:hypothetical protein